LINTFVSAIPAAEIRVDWDGREAALEGASAAIVWRYGLP
jgi:hypothetical protein